MRHAQSERTSSEQSLRGVVRCSTVVRLRPEASFWNVRLRCTRGRVASSSPTVDSARSFPISMPPLGYLAESMPRRSGRSDSGARAGPQQLLPIRPKCVTGRWVQPHHRGASLHTTFRFGSPLV